MNAQTTVLLFVLCICSLSVHALIKDTEDGDPGAPLCEPAVVHQLTLRRNGLPLVGNEIALDARTAKLKLIQPRPGAPANCNTTFHSLASSGGFSWRIVDQPSGSSVALAETSSLLPKLTPERPGAYRIRFTACPQGCAIPLSSGTDFPVAARSKDLVIEVVDEFAYPPAFEPVRPQQDPTTPGQFPGFDGKCQSADELGSFQADTLGPAWVTVERWRGPQDYQLLEGTVSESNVSRRDAILNHHSQDALFFVTPDPRDRRLLQDGQNGRLEIEWESNSFDENAWPTRGDRVSVVGYWIHDCGHGGRTEIHPPVMVATHRARAISVPANENRGSNVFVPGIMTQVYIGRDGGESTGNCSLSGLHQPGGGAGFDFGPHNCLPQTEGFTDGNPINRVFTFTIYLPRNPQDILAEAGKEVPPVPLYRRVFNSEKSGGPDPDFELVQGGNALNVTIDLREFTGDRYTRRIESAWLYAAPDNWGLRRWTFSLPLIDVHNDGDGRLRGDGDWKFWINLNNGRKEWTRLFDCDGCVHGEETFGGTPWSTGSSVAARNLGPDLLLYPRQRYFLQTTGYETDWIWADGTGRVVTVRQPETDPPAVRSNCRRSGPSGCASYTLHYQLNDRGSVGEAELSAEAEQLYDDYLVRAQDEGVITSLPVEELREFNHPADLEITPESPAIDLDQAGFFHEQSIEPGSLADMDNAAFKAAVTRLMTLSPELGDAFLKELAEEVEQARATVPPEELAAGLAAIEDSVPPDVWQRYFAGAPDDKPPFDWRLWLLVVVIALVILARRRF